jgi:alcohol dehydrogenase class IV
VTVPPTAFDFFTLPRLAFGAGVIARLPELVGPLGRHALVVHNGPDPAGRLTPLLESAGVRATYRRQSGEPVVADVDGAVEAARSAGCDCVVGFGGGSAIDAAKAVAGLLTNGGSAVDYMEVVGKGLKVTKPAAPWVAVPTTAGTGAEATRNAVVGLPERRFKASVRSELLLPRAAVVDPELGVDVPPDVTARGGMDALCQLVESYTSTGATPVTDALALHGIPLAARALPRAFRDGRDVAARSDMALAAYLSGVTLTNAGLGAVHGFAAPLGANFPAPHGAVCAALLPHVIPANVVAMRAGAAGHAGLARYATVGRLLAGEPGLADGEAIERCVEVTARLAEELQIPRLGRFGVTAADVPEIVGLARKASSMRFNPVVLSDEVLGAVLRAAI